MSSPAPVAAAGSVAARLNRLPLTRLHRYAAVVVGIGMFFDLYEVFLAGTLAAVLEKDFAVEGNDLKLVLASAFIGAFIGAVLLSRVADRLGRRRAFFLTLGIYSVFSVLAAFAPNLEWLIVCRFVAGIGIGGELPLCDAYLADLLPQKVRGKVIGWAYTVGFCAVPVAGFLARGIAERDVLGIDGWRLMFVFGGVGAAICWAMRRGLPESPRWLEAVGRQDEAERIVEDFEERAVAEHDGPLDEPEPVEVVPFRRERLRTLFAQPWRRRTVMLWVFQCLQTFGYYGFGSLVPIVLVAKGYDITESLTFAALTFLGYPLGSLLSVPLMERFERKALVAGAAGAMLLLGLLFGYTGSTAMVVVAGFLYTVASNVFSNGFHVYQTELYPTRLRATGAGSAYSLSRLATAVMPFVLLPVLENRGPGAVFVVIGLAMAILIADVLVLGPRTTGRALEEVTDASEQSLRAGLTPPPGSVASAPRDRR